MSWRRAAALTAGGALGVAAVAGGPRGELRLTQPAEAFCPCSLTCAAVAASSALLGGAWLLNFGERLAQQQGREVLIQMAEAGDPGAQFVVAAMVAAANGDVEQAVRYYGYCKDTVPDCAVTYALLGGAATDEEANELLKRAGMLAEAEYRELADAAGQNGQLPPVEISPVMPGDSLDIDDDDRYAALLVSRPYLHKALQWNLFKVLVQSPESVSKEARRGELQVMGLRGLQPAFFILGNEMLKEGNEVNAAEYFLRACIAPWHEAPPSTLHHLLLQQSAISRLASVARLCELAKKGVQVPFAEVESDQLRKMLADIQMDQPTPALEHCVTLGKMDNPTMEDHALCADGLELMFEQTWLNMTQLLARHAKEAEMGAEALAREKARAQDSA